MDGKAQQSAELFEASTKLKQFILDAPAPQSKHNEALGWLNTIHSHYQKQLTDQPNGPTTKK